MSRIDPSVAMVLDYLRDLGWHDVYRPLPAAAAAPARSLGATRSGATRSGATQSGATQPGAARSTSPSPAGDAAASAASLDRVAAEAAGCRACALAETRRTVVFGSGHAAADLMFIGEGPGAEEDRQGLPFVGPAGELLTKIIAAIGLSRDRVYIANVVKCRPPANRDPRPEEVTACAGFLARQIDLVAPRVIVLLGRTAAQTLLGTDLSLGRMRGRWYEVRGVPARVTYHPAALLYQASNKRPTWEDMKIVRDRLLSETEG